jgi:hypothetical protein
MIRLDKMFSSSIQCVWLLLLSIPGHAANYSRTEE